MNGVWPAYPKRIADVLRKCNHRFPFLASHTQSTLVIRLSYMYVGDTLLIRYNYAFWRAFCAYEDYFINFHTQLIRFSHTLWCDTAITLQSIQNCECDGILGCQYIGFIGVGIVGTLEMNLNGRHIGLSDYWVHTTHNPEIITLL